ncbi:unnamed protein product, partial [Porites lobata]
TLIYIHSWLYIATVAYCKDEFEANSFTNKQIVWATYEIYAKRSEAQFKRFDQQETRKITQSKRRADKLGFQPSKQGRQELRGLNLQSIIVITYY